MAKIENKYMDYYINKEKDWHEKKVGFYHVSGVGNNHPKLESHEHSGPCLRDTTYGYLAPLPQTLSTMGVFKCGDIHHAYIQKQYKKNHPLSNIEFGLQDILKKGKAKIYSLGSIDILDQKWLFEEKDDGLIHLKILDIKSASQYTFPKNKYDHKPTHFNQTYIYAETLMSRYMDREKVVLDDMTIIYVDKNRVNIAELPIEYKESTGLKKYINYKNRCWKIHGCIKKKTLPEPEPHKWCKYCDNRFRCQADQLEFTERGIEDRRKDKDNYSIEAWELMKSIGAV